MRRIVSERACRDAPAGCRFNAAILGASRRNRRGAPRSLRRSPAFGDRTFRQRVGRLPRPTDPIGVGDLGRGVLAALAGGRVRRNGRRQRRRELSHHTLRGRRSIAGQSAARRGLLAAIQRPVSCVSRWSSCCVRAIGRERSRLPSAIGPSPSRDGKPSASLSSTISVVSAEATETGIGSGSQLAPIATFATRMVAKSSIRIEPLRQPATISPHPHPRFHAELSADLSDPYPLRSRLPPADIRFASDEPGVRPLRADWRTVLTAEGWSPDFRLAQ